VVKKRRFAEPTDRIKTEEQRQMLDEMLALQKKADSIRMALEASMRAQGEIVQVRFM
jgi:hypothetical protein